jgi:hypothetical protein
VAGLPIYPYPQFPPQSAQSVNPDGSMANPFYYLLQALFQRTGSDGGVSSSVGSSISAAGASQTTATTLTSNYNFITAGTGGVLLPAMQPGQSVVVFNLTSSAINVYPPTGASINGLAANTAVSMPANTNTTFVCQSVTAFYTVGLQQTSQYLSAITAASPGISLANGVSKTIASLTLPAGDWTMWAEAVFNDTTGGAPNLSYAAAAIWTTQNNAFPSFAAYPADGGSSAVDFTQAGFSVDEAPSLYLGPLRVLLTVSTTYYLSGFADFSTDTCVAGAAIRARSTQPLAQ